ncbi:major cardiolipin synthase ClsA [Clostridium acetireducens DSM 10703]|uniref:Cardiolipin synthase n=2 Tax=Clostridium TaxID=1485 RepID=A0A1E8EVF9_9CLOT|nr:major cardiolipin synthase ClsA [Clostridium acetireducens DSM 10703]
MKMDFSSFFSLLISINAIIFISIIILERKKPEKTIAWLLVIIIFPPIGLLLYIFLGRNWKVNRLNDNFSPYLKELIWKVLNKVNKTEYIPLIKLLAKNNDSPLFVDNEIKIFKNGKEKFQHLKKELEKAKHHIHIEYFIVKDDSIGNTIKDILIKKAKEGVEVRFIIDRVGSIRLKKSYIRELKKYGVDVIMYSYFLAPLLKFINTQINYRNHRKIVIIDGSVGFIGGMNIGDEYLGKGKLGFWRDIHIMVKGDFVLGIQGVFFDDFLTIKKANEGSFPYEKKLKKYFPKPNKSKGKLMQLVKSGPNSQFPAIMQTILKIINMAKNHIYISTPYFVPTESIMDCLKIAALSGIDIKILFPGKYDHFLVYHASKTYLAELAKCGVKIYYYKEDSFIHSKVITVDGKLCCLGTANMDIRSFELNYEINTVIYNEEVTTKLEKIFLEDLNNSKLITKEDYDNSPKIIKYIECIARIFSSLL